MIRRTVIALLFAASVTHGQDWHTLGALWTEPVGTWTPANLNPDVWFDSSISSSLTLTATNTVLGWNNLGSKNVRAYPYSTARLCALSNNVETIKSGVLFSSAAGSPFSVTGTVSSVATNWLVAMAVKYTSTNSAQFLIDSNIGNPRFILGWSPTDGQAWYYDGSWRGGVANQTNTQVIIYVLDATGASIYRNGALLKSGLGYTKKAIDPIGMMGSSFVDATYFTGYLHELLIFVGSGNSNQISNISAYMKQKWGTP